MVRLVPIIIFGLFVKPGLSIRLSGVSSSNAGDHGLFADTCIRIEDSQATSHSSSLPDPPDLHKLDKVNATSSSKWLGDELYAMAQKEEVMVAQPWPIATNVLIVWPRSFVKQFKKINAEVGEKKRKFTFIGHNWKHGDALASPFAAINRFWVVDFAKQRFTENDWFVDTSVSWNGWQPNPEGGGEFYKELGPFDHSKEWKETYFNVGGNTLTTIPQFKSAKLDEGYFRKLSESEFALCPAGDQPWSFRFVEAMFAKSIPIVASPKHASAELQMGFGTVYSQKIGFHYHLVNKDPKFEYVYNETWAKENLKKALQHHTLMWEYGASIDKHGYLPWPLSSAAALLPR